MRDPAVFTIKLKDRQSTRQIEKVAEISSQSNFYCLLGTCMGTFGKVDATFSFVLKV